MALPMRNVELPQLLCAIALALLPPAAAAAERPDWAFPPPGVTGAPRRPDTGELKRVPGSTRTYTQSQIDSFNDPPDWFPEEHPPMPAIVAHGKESQVRACVSCHLSTGIGHPENSRLAGAPAAYLARQLADFKSGARKGAANMLTFTQAMTADEMKIAADYFAALPVKRWTQVLETETVPRTYFLGTRRMALPTGGKEPIGSRVIEIPEDTERVELRDPNSGFMAYAPPGSLAKGQLLAATGGEGKTIACTICHGPTLKGLGEVPSIAGQSPVNIARQLYLFATGERAGTWAVLMKGVVEKLTNDDIVAISAFAASLEP
jgi:cytochrome c553